MLPTPPRPQLIYKHSLYRLSLAFDWVRVCSSMYGMIHLCNWHTWRIVTAGGMGCDEWLDLELGVGMDAVVLLLLCIELGDVVLALVVFKLFTATCLNWSLAVEVMQVEKEKHGVWVLQRASYYILVKSSLGELYGIPCNSLNWFWLLKPS